MLENRLFTKDEEDLLVLFESNRNGQTYLDLRTDDLVLLDDLHQYSRFVGDQIANLFLANSKEEITFMTSNLADVSKDGSFVDKLIANRRFVNASQVGSKVFVFQRPTIPEQTSIAFPLFVFIWVLLGVFSTAIYIYVKDAYQKRTRKSESQIEAV